MGCNIKWISKRSVKIEGVFEVKETTYSIMFDRIEAGTYLVAAAVTEGNLKIKNIIPKIIQTEINTLKKIGTLFPEMSLLSWTCDKSRGV